MDLKLNAAAVALREVPRWPIPNTISKNRK